jgi:hypothetical protein
MPFLLQAVVHGNTAVFTFYGTGRPITLNGQQQPDYKSEASEVLTKLEMQLGTRANLSKKSLTRVSASIPCHARLQQPLYGGVRYDLPESLLADMYGLFAGMPTTTALATASTATVKLGGMLYCIPNLHGTPRAMLAPCRVFRSRLTLHPKP